ncbi:MAG: DsrH/TusB family sulfur metabolism protein [Conexivisphaerales archaeon]
MTLYLVDESFAQTAFAYAANDPSARIILLQDGVYIARSGAFKGEVYYIGEDATRRGLNEAFPASAHAITFDRLVAMMETDRVVNFL